jgi:DNA-binding response OmpR family regulator
MESTPQSPIRLLIVGDDEATSTGLLEYFRSPTYTTTTVSDADTALRYLVQPPGYDIVLLDMTLPGRSGFDLLADAARHSIKASFLLLSDRDCLEDKLRGFRLGADDYVVKPCAMEEIEARVAAVLGRRRSGASSSNGTHVHVLDDLTINVAANTCVREGRRIPLTSLEFDILSYLVEHRGRVVPREELRDAVWDDRDGICLRTIDRHVAKIREKLEHDPDMPAYLQTVYGKGYEFACAEYA